MSRECCWVIKPNQNIDGKFSKAIYCGKKTKFKMVKDDDGNTVRKYNDFCDEHMDKAEEQKDSEPDWDFE